MDDQVIALSPRCIVCARALGSPELSVFQLHCLHCVCKPCSSDLRQPSGSFQCPIDDCQSEIVFESEDLAQKLQSYWREASGFRSILGTELLQLLTLQVNYQSVPCFELFGGSRPCSMPHCPYSHSRTQVYQKFLCPKLDKCPRKEHYCIFLHPKSEAPLPPDPQSSFRYSQAAPCYICYSARPFQVSLPKAASGVTLVERSQDTMFFTTIQRTQEVGKGYVFVHSLSLHRLLTKENCRLLNEILKRYQAEAQIRMLKVICKKVVNWSYENAEGQRKNFNLLASEVLENAYRAGTPEVLLAPDSLINLKLMIKVCQRKAYTSVFRTEKIVSSSHAAMITLLSPAAKYGEIYREVQGLEQSLLVPDLVPIAAVDSVINEFGLAVGQEGWLKGTREDILSAGKVLKAVPPPDPVSHVSLRPVGVSPTVEELVKANNLLLVNNLLIGRLSDLKRLRQKDVSIAHPRMSHESRDRFCKKYGISERSGQWIGALDSLLEAMSELTECKEALPADITAQEITQLRTNFPVMVEQGAVIGPRNSVKEAVTQLMRGRGEASVPLSAQSLQRVTNLSENTFEKWVFRQEEPCKVEHIPQGHKEFVYVQEKLGGKLHYEVLSVERVFNKKQYLTYAMRREKLKRDEGVPDLPEKDLFHGTRGCDPMEIAVGDEGFKYRYGQGSWGIGFYFSESLEKAAKYGYSLPGQKEVVKFCVCTVLTGLSAREKSNKLLRRPPLRKDGRRYHSVEAHSRASVMWVVYEPEMAYIKYLVTLRLINIT